MLNSITMSSEKQLLTFSMILILTKRDFSLLKTKEIKINSLLHQQSTQNQNSLLKEGTYRKSTLDCMNKV